MSISSLRSRRLAARQTETTHQLIAFRLRQEWFALPIQAVQRVIPLDKVYGDPNGTGISVTTYQGNEILAIDVGQYIFKGVPEAATIASFESDGENPSHQPYLAIIQSNADHLVGLPIDSPPSLRRVPESAFKPLPERYLAKGDIQCVSSLVKSVDSQPPLFLLDCERLIELLR